MRFANRAHRWHAFQYAIKQAPVQALQNQLTLSCCVCLELAELESTPLVYEMQLTSSARHHTPNLQCRHVETVTDARPYDSSKDLA